MEPLYKIIDRWMTIPIYDNEQFLCDFTKLWGKKTISQQVDNKL